MTKTEKTFSTRSNAKRAIGSFRDRNPDLTMVGVSVVPVGDKFAVHATGWENAHVAAIDAAGFIRVECDGAAPTLVESLESREAISDEAFNEGAAPKPPRKTTPAPTARKKAGLTPAAAMRASLARATKAAKAAAPKAKGNGARKAAKPANGERGPTKTDQGLDMLRRKKGVTVAEMGEAFGWLPHTTRAWISATAGKKLGNAIETEVVEGRGRILPHRWLSQKSQGLTPRIKTSQLDWFRRRAAIRDDGPETTAGKGSRWQRPSPTSCGSLRSCDRRRSRQQSACSAVSRSSANG